MEWPVWIAIALGAAANGFLQLKTLSQVRQFRKEVNLLRARQSTIGVQKVMRANPKVDAVARTKVRDSDDLPLTGRMSQGIRRKKSNGRVNNDD